MINNFDNKIIHGDCIIEMKQFDENYFDLVIADPPYFKVVSEKWDYQWRTEDDYIEWCIKWFSEVYRVLRFGGTFYLFGYFRTLALMVKPLLDIGFDFRQQIIINKGIQSIAGRATKNYRMYPNVTESILFLTKKNITFSRNFLKEQQKKCPILKFDLEYEKIAQTFNTEMGITDVWNDISFTSEKRIHPTQKPQKLIQRLINVSSNSGDKVLDPFAGSGSTYIACKKLGRIPTTIEIDENYINLLKNSFL